MADAAVLSAAERQRFIALLPWWLNGSLAAGDQAWMDGAVQRCPWARQAVARERALLQSIAAPEPADAALGLQQLLARVQTEVKAPARRASSQAPQTSWRQTLFSWLAMPRMGAAMALVVLVQAGVIGWLAVVQEPDSGMRSTPVSELRTLRVSVAAGVSEAQWRTALLAAGARVVGGPNQLGEYWLASEIRSLDEMKAVLLAAGVTRSIEIDTQGPHGR